MEYLNESTGFMEESEDTLDINDPFFPHESCTDSWDEQNETAKTFKHKVLHDLLYRYCANTNIRKIPVSTRIDSDILAWFKKNGEGYQTRINAALRAVMETEKSFLK